MVPSARRPLRVRRWDGYALVSENRQNTSRLLTPGAQYRRRCHLLGPWTARRFRQTPLRTQHAYFGTSVTPVQERVLQALRYTGELSTRQLSEETGLQNKQLTPALHRLQQACLVFEDQEDSSWARPWSLMENAWPALDLEKTPWEDAITQVLSRFLQGYVGATFEQLKSWTRLPGRRLVQALAHAEHLGTLVAEDVPGLSQTWMRSEHRRQRASPAAAGVFMLHRSDPLVLADQCALKKRYAEHQVLQYLLIDGEFRGAVCGHWRIGPHDVDDIIVDLSAPECVSRREAILASVSRNYHPPGHHILRYTGKDI